MSRKKIKIAVLMGGPSAEHEVSLNTGKEILAHLDPKKYDALPVMIAKNGQWLLHASEKTKVNLPDGSLALIKKGAALTEASAVKELSQEKADVVFIALHGKYGEDGTVQGLLETVGMPYTGSGVLASALGMDKPRSLTIFREAGIPVPDFMVTRASDLKKNKHSVIAKWIRRFSLPLVVKPADHGSSVGVSIVKKRENIAAAVKEAGQYSKEIIIQKFIRGRELTCGVLEMPGGKIKALPPVEIVPRLAGFYDYRSKYADGGSDHVIPPRGMAARQIKTVQDLALCAHSAIGAAGMSRSDFILAPNGKFYILEINTIPGMTGTSLLPQAAAAAGITFPRLLDAIIRSAMKNP